MVTTCSFLCFHFSEHRCSWHGQ